MDVDVGVEEGCILASEMLVEIHRSVVNRGMFMDAENEIVTTYATFMNMLEFTRCLQLHGTTTEGKQE
jgi:hypothetical protein